MRKPYLDIEDKRIRSFEELKQLFDAPEAKNPGSHMYQTIIDTAVDSVLSKFLEEVGKTELADKLRALDDQQSDLQIMSELQRIITGDIVDITFDPLEFVRVLKTSTNNNGQTVQTCFEIQIMKVVKEDLLFSVVSGTEHDNKSLNLENYRNGEVVRVTQMLSSNVGEVVFYINGKKVSQIALSYTVTFQCNISKARLSIDGNKIASSFPISHELSYGNHSIRVHKAGYEDYEEQIMIKNNCEISIKLQLPPAVGDILCADNAIVSLSEWPVAGKTALGVVFYLDESGHHGWAVHLKDQGRHEWTTVKEMELVQGLRSHKDEKEAKEDLDGYANTNMICAAGDSSSYPSAFAVDLANGWYLPACGQLKELVDRRFKVNESLRKLGGCPIMDNKDVSYWSSTQASACYAWCYYYSLAMRSYKSMNDKQVRAVRTF